MGSTYPDQAEVIAGLAMFIFVALVVLISVALTLLVWCKLFAKAGYSWALGLLMLVPIANIVVPFYLAFADWPIQQEVRQLRQRCAGAPA